MLAWCQLRNTIIGRTTGIGAEVVGEMIIEIVSLGHITINHQLQIVTDTTSCSIDAIPIRKLSHKEWSGIHIASIHK